MSGRVILDGRKMTFLGKLLHRISEFSFTENRFEIVNEKQKCYDAHALLKISHRPETCSGWPDQPGYLLSLFKIFTEMIQVSEERR
jgi:hypothetical protein